MFLSAKGEKYITRPKKEYMSDQLFSKLYGWLINSEQVYIKILEHRWKAMDDPYKCSFVFEFNSKLYQVEYRTSSTGTIDHTQTKIHQVTKVVETVITYKKVPSICDMTFVNLDCYVDIIRNISVIDAIYDTSETLSILSCGLTVNEQSITNLKNGQTPQIGGYLMNLDKQWLYFGPHCQAIFNIS